MNFSEFKKNLQDNNIFTVYLIEGEDGYFREKSLEILKSALISEPSINLVNFSGEQLKDINEEGEFFASLSSFPFMSQKRMTVVTEFYPKQEVIKKIEKLYQEGSLESSVLAIVNEKENEPLKKLSNVCVVSCKKADNSTVSRWVKGTCERAGVKIELQTASLLAEYCLLDMVRVSTETEKLISYAIKKGEITKEDLDLMVYRDTEYKIYEMTDFIAKKNVGKAIEIIFELINKGEPPQKLLTSIYYYFRRLLHVAISSMDDVELSKAFGIKEFAVKKARQQSSYFKKISLKRAVDVLEDADYKFKSGKIDVDQAFYASLFRILLAE
ncbi:MAG: DNA polymerase III subunit delta [Clostridia bacterium]|nr:DNA polymerase III subunit delta [Clostridia bacterium]